MVYFNNMSWHNIKTEILIFKQFLLVVCLYFVSITFATMLPTPFRQWELIGTFRMPSPLLPHAGKPLGANFPLADAVLWFPYGLNLGNFRA